MSRSPYVLAKDPDVALRMLKEGQRTEAEKADTIEYVLEALNIDARRLSLLLQIKDYTIRHYSRIAVNLTSEAKALLHNGKISFSHARVLASMQPDQQAESARNVIAKRTSVTKLRAQLASGHSVDEEALSHYFKKLESVMSEQSGLNIRISRSGNNNAGEIVIRYETLSDFDAACHRLGVELSEL